jgi:hypothetical protein
MMNIVTTLQKDRFTPRYYVAALTDNMSLQKAQVYEQSLIQVEVNHYVPLNQQLCWALARLSKTWNMTIFSAFSEQRNEGWRERSFHADIS